MQYIMVTFIMGSWFMSITRLPMGTSFKNIITISSSHLNISSSYGQISRPFKISPFLSEFLVFHFDSLSEPGPKGIEAG